MIMESPTTAPDRTREFEESFRTLRTNVLLRATAGDKTFLISSARPREGKSTIAAILSRFLAASGRDVLLIDADARRPRLHEIFHVVNGVGFMDLLQDSSAAVTGAVHKIGSQFHLLTSGKSTRDPQQLFLGAALAQRLAEFTKAYDLVLIDSPPILAVADAVLLAPKVDGVLLVFRAGEVTGSEVKLAAERLSTVSARVLGCVLNNASELNGFGYHPYAQEYLERMTERAVLPKAKIQGNGHDA
jgi:capsular exopolysaccharide synthesis family protein